MIWQGLLFGQGICLLNTASGVFSSLLVFYGIEAPLYQLLWFYVGVFLVFGALLLRSTLRKETGIDWRRSARICVACLPDTQGNFLIILSYSFTSITSVAVLLQSSFVMVAGLSYCCIGRRYSVQQYSGLAGCVGGMAVLVVADLQGEGWSFTGGALGDVMTVTGTFLYSVTQVYQEHLLSKGVREHEYLAYIGLWGAVIMTVQTFAMEYGEVRKISTWEQSLCVVGFAVVNVSFYACVPFYIKRFGATMLNISLIPTIVYTLIFSLIVYRSQVGWLYIVGYAVVLLGLCLYCISRDLPARPASLPTDSALLPISS